MIKQVLPGLVVLVACLLLAGIPSLIILITTNSMAGIVGTTKEVMCSGFALFFLILGFMGFYFWTRTDYKHYKKLWILGLVFFFIASLGLQWLLNYAYT
jgi:hypothetical protein